jgi:two-component system chemotaxis sensor kinase CheA
MELPTGFLDDFIVECDEHAESAVANLLLIERGNAGSEPLKEIYRSVHTIKGGAQFAGMNELARLAHFLESCMDPIRKEKARFTPELLNMILGGMDVIAVIRSNIRRTGSEGKVEALVADFCSRLSPLADRVLGTSLQGPGEQKKTEEETINIEDAMKDDFPRSQEEMLDFGADGIVFMEGMAPKPKAENIESEKKMEQPPTNFGEKSADVPALRTSAPVVKVSVHLLDKIMGLIGELVLVRNQFTQKISHVNDDGLHKIGQRLNILTGLIQTEVMRTRMQPISNIISKYHKIVRDLALAQGKKIDLKVDGGDTELDKSLIEALNDPLLHIVRNSADHGVELPQERLAASKSENGNIIIKAYQESGQVIVEVSDDGRGLSRDKILKKAVVQGVVGEGAANLLSDGEIFNLIFLPGFSTAERISDISGRGVGMDVVKTNVEKIGGSIGLSSIPNQGMKIQIKVPLTMAIVPTILVRSSGCTFALPQLKVIELICVGKQGSGLLPIEDIADRPLYRLRGELLPLISVSQILGLGDPLTWQSASQRETLTFIVTGPDDHRVGLVVDEILDSTDIVVKPLSPFLERLKVFSGATVLGDGSIAIIIDADALIQKWMSSEEGKKPFDLHSQRSDGVNSGRASMGESEDFLLFTLPKNEVFAIPSHFAHRLEEVPRSAIHYASKQAVIIYRDSVMPVIDLGVVCSNSPCLVENAELTPGLSQNLALIVIQWHSQCYGVVVESILDVVKCDRRIEEMRTETDNIHGTIIMDRKIIAVVDLFSIVGRWATAGSRAVLSQPDRDIGEVVVVDDSKFYRKHLSQILEHANFRVSAFDSGDACLEYLRSPSGKGISIVVSDVEMPGMSGPELAKEIRKDPSLLHLKILAVSTRNDAECIDYGLRSGFDFYLEKLNPKAFVESVKRLLREVK